MCTKFLSSYIVPKLRYRLTTVNRLLQVTESLKHNTALNLCKSQNHSRMKILIICIYAFKHVQFKFPGMFQA